MAKTQTSRAEQAEIPREEMYREWLGIKYPNPSYYGLLGVPELETEETAVLHAGRRVKRRLRAYQIGLYRKQALDLLAEVGQAVSVLTNPEKKRAYDNELAARWRAAAEELYQTHCDGEANEASIVEAWLTACQMRGVPVTRLMPYLAKKLCQRSGQWARLGEHKLGLPINLWIYRDAVVLGQCLHIGALERRAEAVKTVQKLLGVPTGLALLVAEEVTRSHHLFACSRLVTQAKRDPVEVLVRLGRRVKRYGGDLGPKGKLLAAVARLLGKRKVDLDRALKQVDEPPVELSPAQKASLVARRARQGVRSAGHSVWGLPGRAVGWVGDRPQVLVGLAVMAGVATLALAFLVLTGVISWESEASPTAVTPPKRQPSGVEPSRPVQSTVASPPTVEDAPPEWLVELRKRYPAGDVPTDVPPSPNPKSPEPKQKKPDNGVSFFGVREDGTLVERKPTVPPAPPPLPEKTAPEPPAPKPPAPAPKDPTPAPKAPSPVPEGKEPKPDEADLWPDLSKPKEPSPSDPAPTPPAPKPKPKPKKTPPEDDPWPEL